LNWEFCGSIIDPDSFGCYWLNWVVAPYQRATRGPYNLWLRLLSPWRGPILLKGKIGKGAE
jgi:hypothetical protein